MPYIKTGPLPPWIHPCAGVTLVTHDRAQATSGQGIARLRAWRCDDGCAVQVMFRDESSMTLLSASEDGQLAVFDLSNTVGVDEDDAFQVS